MTEAGWHLDKKVPIALLLTIILQFGAMILWVGAVKAQGDENARRISTIEGQRVSERLSALEAQMTDTKTLLNRMDAKIDRLVERGPK